VTTVTVLHQDAQLVVVDKPAGMIVHRGWATDRDNLLAAVRDRVGRYVYPVHRLDRGASGAVLLALDPVSAAALGRAFAEARVDKRYLALTRGHPPERGVVDHPIPKRPGGERVPAATAYVRLGTWNRYALVECRPKTGRLHQIRRHLKHISCPLIGDVRYGKGDHNRLFRTEYGLNRLALHASCLGFEHPQSHQRMLVHAPLTGALQSCLRVLGLLDAAEPVLA
jgi:tRNA pseudouridine65 synthase